MLAIRSSRLHRAVSAGALATALALSLAACTAPPEEPTVPDETAASSAYESAECPSPNLPGVPSLDFPDGIECGYLTVPEDRSEPDGRQIRIFVMRLPAQSSDPAPDPLVMMAGGPGGGGSFQAASLFGTPIHADRDVIMVDQRGTHLADPLLSCPEYDVALNETFSMPFLAPETTALEVASIQECRDRLAATGADIAAYNTAENAADFADLRIALGIDEWNVYGVSYGTRLALTYLRDHPDGIRSLVLDSVSPPNVNIAEDWWSAPASSLAGLFEACAAEAACAAAYPGLEDEFYATMNRLDQEPIIVQATDAAGEPLTLNIGPFDLVYSIIDASEHRDVSQMPRLIDELAAGDTTLIEEAMLLAMTPEPIIGIGGHALAFTVFCGESANLTTRDAYLARSKEVLPRMPESVFAAHPKQGKLFDECPAWDVPDADPTGAEPPQSDVPVLVLEGDLDAATAPAWVPSATETLSAAQVVDFPMTGHSVLDKSKCALDVMNAFLADPDAGVDGACAAEITVAFDTGG